MLVGAVGFEEDGCGDVEKGTDDHRHDIGECLFVLYPLFGQPGAQGRHGSEEQQATQYKGAAEARLDKQDDQGESGRHLVQDDTEEQVIDGTGRLAVVVHIGIAAQWHAFDERMQSKADEDLHAEARGGMPRGVNMPVFDAAGELFQQELDEKTEQ